jgi:hypothetical protein
LREGQVVVMGTSSPIKSGKVSKPIDGKGGEPLHMPLYSPDFNPSKETLYWYLLAGLVAPNSRYHPLRDPPAFNNSLLLSPSFT